MAITPTGAIYKALKFDGVSSRNYGVYITGEAVFNAPERDVEMITIPGRNGAFALDNGRFQNIEVSYPAGIYADNESDFAEAISEFRNYLCSKRGYCRLQDEYNPNEYRLAIYKSGLDVEPAFLKAGEFTITFECKPQRFLTIGETKQTIATSGDTITNPTLFESGPLLEVEGYGTIGFNGYEIEINNDPIGNVTIASDINESKEKTTISFPEVYLVAGDLIEVADVTFETKYKKTSGSISISSVDTVTPSGDTSTTPTVTATPEISSVVFTTPLEFYYGTPDEKEVDVKVKFMMSDGAHSVEPTFKYFVRYDGNKTIEFNNFTRGFSYIFGSPLYTTVRYEVQTEKTTASSIIAHSTATSFGHPTYIDCDIGEAYADDNGVISSLNSYIDLGSKLPTLAPGSNAITFDNTITDLKITPRWWKV